MSSLNTRVYFKVINKATKTVKLAKIRKQFNIEQVNDDITLYEVDKTIVGFGATTQHEVDTKPLKSLSKDLTSLGFGSRDNHGRAIRTAVKSVTKEIEDFNVDNAVYGIYSNADRIIVSILDHTAIDHEWHRMQSIVLDITFGNRIKIERHYSDMTQKHNPYYKGMKKNMFHVIDTDKVENRGGAREAKKIEITEKNIKEESPFVIKLAEVVNHNADVTNELLEQNKALIKILVENGIQVPFEMYLSPEEYEDECQFEAEHSANVKHSYRFN